jgi:lipopolysaccharide/colanic/teichoic acid biosynthesis glycosyltransferase
MSLVVPRPEMSFIVDKYGPMERERLRAKPGLTGLWQVSVRNLLSYEECVSLDVWYVLNWSPWLDLVILVRTVGTVITQRGSF